MKGNIMRWYSPADAKAQAGAMWAQTALCHWSRRIGGHGDTIAFDKACELPAVAAIRDAA